MKSVGGFRKTPSRRARTAAMCRGLKKDEKLIVKSLSEEYKMYWHAGYSRHFDAMRTVEHDTRLAVCGAQYDNGAHAFHLAQT